ncbi:hypothetical protein GCM10010307_72860 [Streptomyces vastus]|uniref:Uncharacterized protein n=1 Tax=Streptomyces vastus TaxID=285451 RepID=A0ABN3RQE4_9ACTN
MDVMRKRLEAPPGGRIPGPVSTPWSGHSCPPRGTAARTRRSSDAATARPALRAAEWEIKGYPNGYRLEELGTRPVDGVRGCPVRHGERPVAD